MSWVFSTQGAIMINCSGEQKKERSDDVFLEGGLFFLLTFMTPPPLPVSHHASLRPLLLLQPPLAARRLFSPPDWLPRPSITRASAYLPNVWAGKDGILLWGCNSWLPSTLPKQCPKEQREEDTAIQKDFFTFLYPWNNQSAARTRDEARGRTARKRGK